MCVLGSSKSLPQLTDALVQMLLDEHSVSQLLSVLHTVVLLFLYLSGQHDVVCSCGICLFVCLSVVTKCTFFLNCLQMLIHDTFALQDSTHFSYW